MSRKVKRGRKKTGGPRYWLFVTRPEYYEGFEEDIAYELDWWTCHEETKEGDLILLYCASPESAIGYLLQATSDAFSLEHDAYALEQGWRFGCGVAPLHKFAPPITFKELGEVAGIREWSVYRKRFQGTVFRIPPEVWEEINALRLEEDCGYANVLTAEVRRGNLPRKIQREVDLEAKIFENLGVFEKVGYYLEPYVNPRKGITGRQVMCEGYRGRIDVLCVDKSDNKFVVIELKNVKAPLRAFSQISFYTGWVRKKLTRGEPVLGLIISRGADDRLRLVLETSPLINQIDLTDIGFKV